MPSIYNYLNYREFLRDFFVEQKQQQQPLTHRAVLGRMGISSTGFIANIISGKKNLTEEATERLGSALRLARREQRYLKEMTQYMQCASLEEKKKHLDRIIALRKDGVSPMSPNQMTVFSKWYYVYIRDVLCFMDFHGDYEQLASMLEPAIKPDEARQAVEDLERVGLIKRDENGRYYSPEAIVSTGDEVQSVQLANFQLTTMDLAKRSLEKHPANRRDISFVTLTLSQQSYSQVKSEIQMFRKRLLQAARQEETPDRLYQCNIQLFPATKAPEDNHA